MKLSPEAVAFRAKIDAEGPEWPDDLKDAATWLRCELENVLRKGWRETGGPARLAQYMERFVYLYRRWQSGQ